MSDTHVRTVQAIYEAFGRGDVPGILAHLAEDIAWDHDSPSWGLPWYEPLTGVAAIPGFFRELAAHTVIHRFEPLNFLVGGDQVAVPIDIEMEVKRTGRRVRDREIHLWTFGPDGKVQRFAHVLDRHGQLMAWRGQEP